MHGAKSWCCSAIAKAFTSKCRRRDLKGENILQALDGRWVICDFGSAQTLDLVPQHADFARMEALAHRTTTAAYRAPEVCI